MAAVEAFRDAGGLLPDHRQPSYPLYSADSSRLCGPESNSPGKCKSLLQKVTNYSSEFTNSIDGRGANAIFLYWSHLCCAWSENLPLRCPSDSERSLPSEFALKMD